MEEDADLSNIILHIFEKQKQNGSDVQYSDKFKCVNIGKTYLVNVIVNFPSCLNGNINKWKKRIENLYGHVNFRVAKNITNIDENELSYNKSYFLCNVFKSTADTNTHLKLHVSWFSKVVRPIKESSNKMGCHKSLISKNLFGLIGNNFKCLID